MTLVSDDDHFLFTPMLYEYLGEVEAWHIAPRFNELINEGDVRLIHDEVTSIDLEAQRVTLESSRSAGIRRSDSRRAALHYVGVEGADQHSIPFRKIKHADTLRRRMVDALDRIPPKHRHRTCDAN